MKKLLVLTLLSVLILSALSACDLFKNDPKPPINESEVQAFSDKVTEAATGQIIRIEMSENQSIPYRWQPEITDDRFIKQLNDTIDTSGATSNMPGSGGEVHLFYYEALKAGDCTIEMNMVRIDDDEDIPHTESYRIHITDH
ncbi:MAG: protease inhibitor I42 family protein [Coriobacteriales bacterium]|jgi:predicted secreted protein|nr:protease inhibitor I42 family protein [Coriobacteriales bacterium]